MPNSSSQSNQLPESELLTIDEVANYLRVTRVTVWRWCQEGIIPSFQVGRSWRIPRLKFLEFQADQINGGATLTEQTPLTKE